MTSIDNVEATDHLLQQSMRSLRGMTWGGYFYNLVSGEGKLQPASTTVRSRQGARGPDLSTGKSTTPGINVGVERSSQSEGLSQPNTNTNTKKQQQDAEIEKLSQSITRLQGVSESIAETLEDHDEVASSLVDKVEDTSDYALTVTLRAAQMTQRTTGSKAVLVGEFKLRTLHRNFLSVFDEGITLTPQFNWSTVFRIYCKENNLYAIQNVKTRKFLGLNLWGSVVATSSGFGRNQEVHIDLKPPRGQGQEQGHTGILFLNSNWGGGGWLRPDKDGVLRAVTSSLLDREDRLLVAPLPLQEEDYRRLKNM